MNKSEKQNDGTANHVAYIVTVGNMVSCKVLSKKFYFFCAECVLYFFQTVICGK